MATREEYDALAHAIQTGVAMEMELGGGAGGGIGSATSPKHLRVGVNMAMCDHAALVRLLVAKGLFTEEEYFDEIVNELHREVVRYENRLSRFGPTIKLV